MLTLLLTACGSMATGTITDEDPWVAPDSADTAAPQDSAETDPTETDPDTDEDTEPPLAEDDADITSVSIPASLACGDAYDAVVTVRNTGSATWTWADGYKLGAVGDEDLLLTGDSRVWLDEDDVVQPGHEHSFVLPLVAPDDYSGATTSDWQMVHEGVHWFGEDLARTLDVTCEAPEPDEPLSLPDMGDVVYDAAAERPDLLAASCVDDGGNNDFLDLVVDRLRLTDARWGYNWKRGNAGDLSQDVVDFHWGSGSREGSTDVYIIDMIVGHCGASPEPGWNDVTQATADAGTVGKWTGNGRF